MSTKRTVLVAGLMVFALSVTFAVGFSQGVKCGAHQPSGLTFGQGFTKGVRYGLVAYVTEPNEDDIPTITEKSSPMVLPGGSEACRTGSAWSDRGTVTNWFEFSGMSNMEWLIVYSDQRRKYNFVVNELGLTGAEPSALWVFGKAPDHMIEVAKRVCLTNKVEIVFMSPNQQQQNASEPQTVKEAVDWIVANTSEKDKEFARMHAPEAVHHTAGQAARNDWKLWVKESPIVQDAIRTYRIAHADDISGLIYAWAWAIIRGESFDPLEHVKRYEAHWQSESGKTALQAGGVEC